MSAVIGDLLRKEYAEIGSGVLMLMHGVAFTTNPLTGRIINVFKDLYINIHTHFL